MMAFGIIGMVTLLFYRLFRGYVDVWDLMLFAIWAVIAICGAIRGRDSG